MTQLSRACAVTAWIGLLWLAVGCVKPSFKEGEDAAQPRTREEDAGLDARLPPRDAGPDAGQDAAAAPITPDQPTGAVAPCIVGVSKLNECKL